MRLLRYVLLEAALLLAGTLTVGVGLHKGCGALGRRAEARAQLALARAYPLREAHARPNDPPVASEASGVFLGMADDLLLERIRTGRITKVKVNRGGSSLSFRLDFHDGGHAAFKPAQTNLQTIPRKEIAAYRLCRLLGLTGVPPAAPRAVTRDELLNNLQPESAASLPRIRAETLFTPEGKTLGAVSYWIPEIRDAGFDSPEGMRQMALWLKIGADVPDEAAALVAQFSNLVVFDFLTANPDRFSGGNLKMSPEGDRLYFMDNTMAFFLSPEGHAKNRRWLEETQRFSRRLYQALGRVTAARLERLMVNDTWQQEILTASEIRAVLQRREVAQRHIEGLIATHGEANVLSWP